MINRFREAVRVQDDGVSLFSVVKSCYVEGIASTEVYEVLSELRRECQAAHDERSEEVVADVMDYVWHHTNPKSQ